MASFSCHVFDVAKQVRLERIVRPRYLDREGALLRPPPDGLPLPDGQPPPFP